jgi:DNA adenine methylase
MQYSGGKHYLKRKLEAAILGYTTCRGPYFEPFVGGANSFEVLAPNFSSSHASDVHKDLIMLYKAVASGWEPPRSIDELTYQELRHAPPSALRAFVGFGVSFGGKWFGGYAKDNPGECHYYADASARKLLKIRYILAASSITCCSYDCVKPPTGSVVYCDPPYRDTLEFGGVEPFDSDKFWRVAGEWAQRGVHVFVSEYSAPAGWRSIMDHDALLHVKRTSSKRERRTERLFVYEP